MMGLPQRFWAKVNKDGPAWNGSRCWLWLAHIHPSGYGQFWWQGRMVRAHVLAYEAAYGPVPTESELDHLCRIKHCVNPAHLEAVSHQVNMRRGASGTLKHEWAPCSLCGDPDGYVGTGKQTPQRISGARFGLDGNLCARCYNRLRWRQGQLIRRVGA